MRCMVEIPNIFRNVSIKLNGLNFAFDPLLKDICFINASEFLVLMNTALKL